MSAGYALGYFLFPVIFGLLGLWFIVWLITRIVLATVKSTRARDDAVPTASERLHRP